jgi:hypothetical protein
MAFPAITDHVARSRADTRPRTLFDQVVLEAELVAS